MSQLRPGEKHLFERIVDHVGRRVLVGIDFVVDDLLLFFQFPVGKSRMEGDVGDQLHSLRKVASQGRGVDRRILLGGEGVEFAAEVFEPAVHLVSLAVLRAFEQGVFGEMGQSELILQLVAASGVYQQGAVRDVAFDPTVNAPDAVGKRIGSKFHRCLIRFSRSAR